MKRIACAVGLVVLVFGVAILARTQTQSVEQELMKLEDEWGNALIKHDPAPLDKVLADDFMGTTANGGVYPKAQLLEFVKSGKEDIISMVGDELIVRVYGDAAVVTFRDTIKMRVKGKETTYLERYTDTWIRRDARWQCVASHGSRIAQK